MSRGDRVELRGLGAFSVKVRPARTGRNPRTGTPVPVSKKVVPFFKTGKEMRERLNSDAPKGSRPVSAASPEMRVLDLERARSAGISPTTHLRGSLNTPEERA